MRDARRSRKGRVALVVVACVLAVALVIGGMLVVRHVRFERQMRDVVYSKEAAVQYRKVLRSFDPKALTKDGVIKSYQVGDGFGHNPMGGIDVTLTINNDPDMYIATSLNRYYDEAGKLGPLEAGAMVTTPKLEDALDKAYPNRDQNGHVPDGSSSDDAKQGDDHDKLH